MGSGPDGSNDTILKFVSRPGAEPIECQTRKLTNTHTHTEYGYYNIDFDVRRKKRKTLYNNMKIQEFQRNLSFICAFSFQ